MIQRDRPEDCLSDFTLDRSLGGELRGSEEARASEHVASCARCAKRKSAIALEREAFVREAPPLHLAARARARSKAWFLAGGALAAAAAVALWMHAPADGGIRTKGAPFRLGFYVSHGGVVRPGAAGERVAPGDALRFTYRAADARYVAVLSVDPAKHASVYYPAEGAPPRMEAGADVALPLSTVLDETVGDERIYGVGCAEPFDVEALRRSLERAPERTPALPPDCALESLVLHKEAPPRP